VGYGRGMCRKGVSTVPFPSQPCRLPLSRWQQHGITVPWTDGGSVGATPDDCIKAMQVPLQYRCRSYLSTPVLESQHSVDLLQWCRVFAATYTVLSIVAHRILSIPVSDQRTVRTPVQHGCQCHHRLATSTPCTRCCSSALVAIVTISRYRRRRLCHDIAIHKSLQF